MQKSKITPALSITGLGGTGLISIGWDGIREYIMNYNPFLSNIIFFTSLFLFLLGMCWIIYDKIKITKWQIIIFYLIPILIISFSAGGVISSFIKNTNLTPADKLESIYNQSFINETVEIDGKRFVKCKFRNVTLVWERDNFAFDDSEITHNSRIKINNPLTTKIVNIMIQTYQLQNLIGSIPHPLK